ncbi:MAG: alpha/beta hydrolase, partial [SAR202 cluster bacterium]|nr:alpha/beta hydrolase [SAR202 cluster bacterium]
FVDDEHVRARFASILPTKALPFDQRVEELMKTETTRDAAEVRAEKLGNMSESVMTEAFKGGTIPDPKRILSNVDCPSMVILGDPSKGGVVDWADRARLRELLRDSKILEWHEVGHGPHYDAPDRFVTAVSDFLQTLS